MYIYKYLVVSISSDYPTLWESRRRLPYELTIYLSMDEMEEIEKMEEKEKIEDKNEMEKKEEIEEMEAKEKIENKKEMEKK